MVGRVPKGRTEHASDNVGLRSEVRSRDLSPRTIHFQRDGERQLVYHVQASSLGRDLTRSGQTLRVTII